MEWNREMDPKKKKILLLVLGLIILIILVIVFVAVFFINNQSQEDVNNFTYRVDPYSSEIMVDIDEEPELEPGFVLIGFYQILEYGLMDVQYWEIINAVTEYMTNNYPDVMQVSYWSETFKIDNFEEGKYSFKFVAEDESVYKVYLDTELTLDKINVEIVPESS